MRGLLILVFPLSEEYDLAEAYFNSKPPPKDINYWIGSEEYIKSGEFKIKWYNIT